MEEALRALLKADSGLITLTSTRIDWGARTQGAGSPAVVLHRISGVRGQHMQGPDGLIESRVQVDCLGATYALAKETARAVIAVLNGHRGGVFQRIFVESERDDHDLSPPDPLYRTRLDLLIWHS